VKPEWLIEIAPLYYDVPTFQKGPVKQALERALERMKRKEALASGRRF